MAAEPKNVSAEPQPPTDDLARDGSTESPEQCAGEEQAGARRIVPWRKQVTIRGLVASLVIGFLYSVITLKLGLTTGLIPNLNVSVALLAFVTIKTWTGLLHKAGIVSTPFTRQENTVVQTCAVACYSMTFGGGFGSYTLGLNKRTYEQAGVDTPGNVPGSYKEPAFGWMFGFLFATAFVGLLALVPLRKALIIDYNLPYPTGTATAVLINGFHSDRGNDAAKKQVMGFVKYSGLSFLWGFFQWFFSGQASSCGFSQFPTFGLEAFKQSFFFDFSMTYVGAGMICPHIVNLSLLVGAVLSWGLMWPLISGLKGDWYPAGIPSGSMKSLNGYKVFVSIALILGDGLYNFLKILVCTCRNLHDRRNQKTSKTYPDDQTQSQDEQKQNELFMRERIPMWVALVGYAALSAISIIVVPLMFPELKWYYATVAYLIAPALGFCNAYGTGLTDMNMGYNYGKVALFVLAALSGRDSGVVAGLVGCGLIKAVAATCGDLMQDFKTAQLTLTSPRSMLYSQVIGTMMGCVLAPGAFLVFYNAFDVGNPSGEYKAPYALIYRNMAIVAVEGFGALPGHCLQLCCGFFAFAVVLNLVKDFAPRKVVGKWVPVPMAMAVPFLVGASFAIDMCVGSLIVFAWRKVHKSKASMMVPAVASGLICGEGMWLLPSALLALAKVSPPICMTFLANKKAA
uniref:Uncharacterized protein n=1 Tax=Kalanchoe fedtschenkoi TaxID=63787 RepID=A0A7N0U5E1_KALFE